MKRKIIFILLALALLAVAAVSAWQVYVPLQEDAESIRAYKDLTTYVRLPDIAVEPQRPETDALESSIQAEETPEPVSTLPQVDFAALQAINPDVVGWIIIEGTNINYPVVQGKDNQSKSLLQSEITPLPTDSVLTLSTCSYEFANARFVLHGVMKHTS